MKKESITESIIFSRSAKFFLSSPIPIGAIVSLLVFISAHIIYYLFTSVKTLDAGTNFEKV